MLKKFEGQIQFVYYSFALRERSRIAAQAALCAGEQGKFWEFHHMVFQQQARWTRLSRPLSKLLELASPLELDREAVRSCVSSGRMVSLVDADRAYGQSLQVRSTPTVFINQRRIVGAQSEYDFVRTIRQELNRAKRNAQ